MSESLTVRPMARAEVDTLVEWAALEGWNPGLQDADIFWANDADAFVAAEIDNEVIGGGAITSYGGAYGFMGFFIVRPTHRGRGLGDQLWHARLNRLRQRLDVGATIGLDGVFDMQPYYAKGGFKFSHRNLRYQLDDGARCSPEVATEIVALDDIAMAEVEAYDLRCFGFPRDAFLSRWIAQPQVKALGWYDAGELKGYGVLRRCLEGAKIGPLFADNADIARGLFTHLCATGAGGPVYLDAPENNPAAMALVKEFNMTEVFGCARMYIGEPPAVEHDKIFGISTFELG